MDIHVSLDSSCTAMMTCRNDMGYKSLLLITTVYILQAKHLAQLVVAGIQVVGRAFAKALRQEIAGNVNISTFVLKWKPVIIIVF